MNLQGARSLGGGRLAIALVLLCLTGSMHSVAAQEHQVRDGVVTGEPVQEAVIQIDGRLCEYRRNVVDGALRGLPPVRDVVFVNREGKVLVRFVEGELHAGELAETVERALTEGWGCKASIERVGNHAYRGG